jgi:hypothetical protein
LIEPSLKLDAKENIDDNKKVQFYSPPAVLTRIANGIHDAEPRLKIIPLATVFDVSEVTPTESKLSDGSKGRWYNPYQE